MSERRAPVQRDTNRSPGTISWGEHLRVWEAYAAKFSGQSAERIAERGGFGYDEIIMLTGKAPETWEPRKPRLNLWDGL
jgi:hypothetical protein